MSHKLSTQDIDWEMDTSSLRKHLLSLTKPKLIKLCKSINVSYTNTETKQEMVNMLLKQKHSIKSVKHKRKSIQKTDSKSNAIESNYFPKGGYPIFENKLEPIARILLIAVYDDNHPLSIFRGMRYIIKAIWELVLQFNKNYYSQCIEIKDDPFVEKDHDFQSTDKSVAFKLINESALCASNGHEYFKTLKFPYPLRKEININMMPIKMSYDINKLKASARGKWSLFVMDLDHLKCWNTCIGHIKTDLLIQNIGAVMKKYIKDINDKKWINKEKGLLEEAYIYRTGGDEFVMAVRCGGWAAWNKLGSFYSCMKKDINNIGLNIKELIFDNNEKEWNDVKKKLNEAKDRSGNPIQMNIIGISTGLFIPTNTNKEKDWLSLGDKIALEHAKTVYLPKKNGIAIYYEYIGCLIPDEKVLECLEKGVHDGLQSVK
eukprot:203593_1